MSRARARRKPSLPPLVRYQVNMFRPNTEWNDWDSFSSHASAISLAKGYSDDACVCIVRRLSDGRIVWRNKAAKEAGL